MSAKGKLVKLNEYLRNELNVENKPIVFVVGATSIGNPTKELEYTDETISISNYPLSA